MRIIILTALTTLSLFNLCCSGMQLTDRNVYSELQSTAESIKKDRKYIYKLDDKIIGEKGYFYIIRSDGKISYHPKKALINYDLSGYAFVQKILSDRNGCISSNADGAWRYIFFREIDSDEILCLTIISKEFDENINECYSESDEKK